MAETEAQHPPKDPQDIAGDAVDGSQATPSQMAAKPSTESHLSHPESQPKLVPSQDEQRPQTHSQERDAPMAQTITPSLQSSAEGLPAVATLDESTVVAQPNQSDVQSTAGTSGYHVAGVATAPAAGSEGIDLIPSSAGEKATSASSHTSGADLQTGALDLTPATFTAATSLLPQTEVPHATTPSLEPEPLTATSTTGAAIPAVEGTLHAGPSEGHVEPSVSQATALDPEHGKETVSGSGNPPEFESGPKHEPEPRSTTTAADPALLQTQALPQDLSSTPSSAMTSSGPFSADADAQVLPDTGEPTLAAGGAATILNAEDPVPESSLPVQADEDEDAADDETFGDDGFSDTDSAIGGMSYVSSLTSVTDSIYEALEDGGRTYHSYKAGKYMLPNDQREQERLDTQHRIWTILNDGKLFRAPLEPHKINRVLDLATGTGIWAIDFADDFPNAEVIGSDLSPIQPRWCPPNCHFEVDDAEDEWVWNQPFSYIHGRALLTCFADAKEVIRKAFDALEPGGYLEYQDAIFPWHYEDPSMPPVEAGRMDRPYEAPSQRWEQLTLEASILGGRRWDCAQHYKRYFEEAGFVDVVEVRNRMPIGVWKGLTAKEKAVGALHGPNIYNALDMLSHKNFQRLGISSEETSEIVAAARSVLAHNKVGAHNVEVTVYGRKPE